MRMLLVVSNRLPIILQKTEGEWTSRPGAGGLITAFMPLLKKWGGAWIGWPGVSGDAAENQAVLAELERFSAREGYQLSPVARGAEEYDRFYKGFANEIIWPLFHDFQGRCNFVPEYWTTYQEVEKHFADAVQKQAQEDDFIWVQDYHLMGLGRRLRGLGMKQRCSFFLHIPFPPPDIFSKLPWRNDVLSGLLQYDVVGLQTPRDLENLHDCFKRLMPDAEVALQGNLLELRHGDRECRAGVFPIGIDYESFAAEAASAEVKTILKDLKQNLTGQIVLGLDRLDYTKGIPYRLKSYELALRRYPELHKAVTLLQVVVPSRESVQEYQDLKREIEQMVARINGEFTQPGWVPIHHVFRSLTRQDMIAYYRLADIGLVTPLKDGMNLVAKEYCACQTDSNGVLILSEFAGSAVQLANGAVLVNPYDIDSVAAAIHKAVLMSPAQRRPAMTALRKTIAQENVHWWMATFLAANGMELPPEPPKEPKPQGLLGRLLQKT